MAERRTSAGRACHLHVQRRAAMQDSSVKVGQDVETILIRIRDGRIERPLRYVDIYYKQPGAVHNDNRKPELQWIASGLEDGQMIYITAKAGTYFGYMDKECYGPIVSPGVALTSGPVRRAPKDGGVIWSYGVTLTDSDGTPLDSYDPDVHIDKDP
jgi:hypothetical protein